MNADPCGGGSVFLKRKALEYFANYSRKIKGRIDDVDTLRIITDVLPDRQILSEAQKHLPVDKLKVVKRSGGWLSMVDNNSAAEILRELWNAEETMRHTRHLVAALLDMAHEYLAARRGKKDYFEERFHGLCQFFRLSKLDADILLLRFLLNQHVLEGLPFRHRENQIDKSEQIAIWLNKPLFLIRKAVEADGMLRKYNCLDRDLDFNNDYGGYLTGVNKEPLANSFYKWEKNEALPWEFYGALAEKHGTILKEMLRARKNRRGMHILLYGIPGTGKTSFAKSLAAELGHDCYSIAQDVKADNTARTCCTPDYRFGALRICDSQVDPDRSLVIVDEADDMLRGNHGGGWMSALLGGDGFTTGDKGILNSVLDEIRTPCVWISNTSAEALDQSSRRRFDYSIRFDKLTAAQRLAIWKNCAGKYKLGRLLPRAMQEKLAERYEVSAGGIAMVLKNIAGLKPKAAECEALVDKLMKQHCELLEIQTDRGKWLPAADYSLEGLNIKSDLPLERVVGAVRRFQEESAENVAKGIDRPRMNLLLSGPPGTGKTEFVKYLGAALKTKVVVRMGSDILSMWVGGTEQNIKRAFDEAEAETAILFFDEIDGLLQDRGMAQHSWEMTQVNELLHRMENFNGVMIGATNFTDTLDPAVARRFTFKLEFRYLDEAGKRLFYERMFRSTLSPAESKRLMGIPDLAPGDFRTVRQGLYYLGRAIANEDRLAALERESQAKGHNRHTTKKIGF